MQVARAQEAESAGGHDFSLPFPGMVSAEASAASFGQPSIVSRLETLSQLPPADLASSLQQLAADNATMELLDTRPEAFRTALRALASCLVTADAHAWQHGLSFLRAVETVCRHVPTHSQTLLLVLCELAESRREGACQWGASPVNTWHAVCASAL